MKTYILRKDNVATLKIKLLNLLHSKFSLRMQITDSKTKKTHQFKNIQHNIARIKTILTEKR